MKKKKTFRTLGVLLCIANAVCLGIVCRNYYYLGYFFDMFGQRAENVYGGNAWVWISWAVPALLLVALLLSIAVVINSAGEDE